MNSPKKIFELENDVYSVNTVSFVVKTLDLALNPSILASEYKNYVNLGG